MLRTLSIALALLAAVGTPLFAQTTYTWNPATTGTSTWDTTSAIWSSTGPTGPFDKVFTNATTNHAVLGLTSGTANLTASVPLRFGQLRVASDGFTVTNAVSGGASNTFGITDGIHTLGGPRSLNLVVSGTGPTYQNFIISGNGSTSAGKLTLTVGGVSQYGLRIDSGTALGTNTDLIATGTTGSVGIIGTRILLGSGVNMNAGVNLTLNSSSAGNLQSTLMATIGTTSWNGSVNLVGDGTVNIDAAASNGLFIAGNVTSTAAGQAMLWGTGQGSISGQVSGATGITKVQGGAWHLENLNNSYTGATSIQGGTVFVYKLANAGQNSSIGAATGSNATIRLGNPGSSTDVTLSYNWANASSGTNRDIELVGSGGSRMIYASATSNVFLTLDGNITSTGGSKTLNLAGGNFLSGGTINGVISGSGVSVAKSGSSIWTLNGNNTYGGTTSVSGRLVINGNQSAATGNVSVGGSGVLGGTGTVGGATTISTGGLIRGDIGTGTGTLNVANNVTINGGGATAAGGGISAAVSDTGVNSATASKINLTGAADRLTIAIPTGSSNRFRIQLEQGSTPITTDGTESYTIILASVATAGNIYLDTTSLTANTVIPTTRYDLSAIGFQLQAGSVLKIDETGRNLILSFTPVPEPATIGLVAVASGILLAARRRFRR